MHNKLKGNIAEAAVAKDLCKHGFNVFKEFGDLSRIDLIAEKNGKLIKIQVKWATDFKDYYDVDFVKSGPNGYKFKYTPELIDLYAVYLNTVDKVIYVPIKDLEGRTHIIIRINLPKNNQKKNVHFINDFNSDQILRDYTRSTCDGDDIVQTTTVENTGLGN